MKIGSKKGKGKEVIKVLNAKNATLI